MNTGTRIRTVLVIVTSLNTALMATDVTGFHNHTLDVIYTVASIVFNFIIVALVTYFNNDYTPTSAKHTGKMRMEKEYLKNGTDGEDFFNLPDGEDGEKS